MASNSKQYGLIIPQKANQGLVRSRPSVFNESSDSGEEAGGATDWVRKALKRESEKTFQKKQHQLDIQKALEEDPTVYQYDEVYDKIEEKKAELTNAKKQQNKKPRYIQSLLLQAEKRKREQERRNERIIQKEREAEGDTFKDKESFVTSAYRQKLEEFKQLEEEEKRQDAIEALTDVSKQKDLSGFYRHLYRTTVSGEGDPVVVKQEPDDNETKGTAESAIVKQGKDDNGALDESKEEALIHKNKENRDEPHSHERNDPKPVDDSHHTDKKSNSRHYRKREDTSGSSDSERESSSKSKQKPKTTENLDADSDFSLDSDSSESESESSSGNSAKKSNERKRKRSKNEEISGKSDSNVKENNASHSENVQSKKQVENDTDEVPNKKVKEDKDKNDENIPSSKVSEKDRKETTPKPNIWIKRTVGEVFESALQRYYQRKAVKLASKG